MSFSSTLFTPIENEVSSSYLSYAMSVIVSRAIPDLRDGLKPVHRRILFAMFELNCYHNSNYSKSAKIVGEVMGRYHPHGDSAIYDSLVRMAQDFSLFIPLIDGQGNFGSMDGDPPAAMRYTESRLSLFAHCLLNDINEETVDFVPNYDKSAEEPTILPAEFPNILVNGTSGVAVGMATNVATHNLTEILELCQIFLRKSSENISIEDIMKVVKAPDFPTGSYILNSPGIKTAFETGRGSIIMRAKTHIEELDYGKKAIIVDEIPYQVNKAKMIENIAGLINDKRISGIVDLRDESDRKGIRVVIELRRDAIPDVILNQLFKLSQLQTTFSVNMVLLRNGEPALMSLKDIIADFLIFRKQVVVRRTTYRLNKAASKAHLLLGLNIAIANIDEIVKIIKASKNKEDATNALLSKEWTFDGSSLIKELAELVGGNDYVIVDNCCKFSLQQAKAILDMRLHNLTTLEKNKLEAEIRVLIDDIKRYNEILSSKEVLIDLIYNEFEAIKNKFPSPRKSEILSVVDIDSDMDDLIQREDMVIIMTYDGYIKRTPLQLYKQQKRGGKGRSGQKLKETDIIIKIFVTNTHNNVFFFSKFGKVYKSKVYNLPIGDHTSRGRSMLNLFDLEEGDSITSVMPIPDTDDLKDLNIIFATKNGKIRRNSINDFEYIPKNGKIAIKLDDSDKLIDVKACKDSANILISTRFGKIIRFEVDKVRVFKSRTSEGVIGKKLTNNDEVVSFSVLNEGKIEEEAKNNYLNYFNDSGVEELRQSFMNNKDQLPLPKENLPCPLEHITSAIQSEKFILAVTENGFGKISSSYDYRITNRGGLGIINIITSKRNGNVVASFSVDRKDQLIIITSKGRVIRVSINNIRVTRRNTQGVMLFRINKNEKIASVAKVIDSEDKSNDEDIENANIEEDNYEEGIEE